MGERVEKQIEIRNKKASFEYHFLEEYSAGMMLTGTEIKSIRQGKANLQDAYCLLSNGEIWVKNMHISPYEKGTYLNHSPLRDRKLLLQKKEIRKLDKKLKDVGITLIPTRLYINEKGLAKLDIALAKGKKLFDKRNDIKEKDQRRDLAREMK